MQGRKRLKTIFSVLLIILVIAFLVVFVLAKQKKIFINTWFVDENKSTIGADVSSYQADINMNELKEQSIAFIYTKATEGSSLVDERFSCGQ